MAKAKDQKGKAGQAPAEYVNRRARHEYHIEETLETGIVLSGTEVKSLREGRASLAEGFARVDPHRRELFLHNVEIQPYRNASVNQHVPKQPRKLLAHRREIEKLIGATTSKGRTLVPLKMYFVRGRVKVQIGLAVGKKQHDKRQDIKKRDAERDMRRAMTRKKL